jgi:hypothetical protein
VIQGLIPYRTVTRCCRARLVFRYDQTPDDIQRGELWDKQRGIVEAREEILRHARRLLKWDVPDAPAYFTRETYVAVTVDSNTGAVIERAYPAGSRVTPEFLYDNAANWVVPRLRLHKPGRESANLQQALRQSFRYWTGREVKTRRPGSGCTEPLYLSKLNAGAVDCEPDVGFRSPEREVINREVYAILDEVILGALADKTLKQRDWERLIAYAETWSGSEYSYQRAAEATGRSRDAAIDSVRRARAVLRPRLVARGVDLESDKVGVDQLATFVEGNGGTEE